MRKISRREVRFYAYYSVTIQLEKNVQTCTKFGASIYVGGHKFHVSKNKFHVGSYMYQFSSLGSKYQIWRMKNQGLRPLKQKINWKEGAERQEHQGIMKLKIQVKETGSSVAVKLEENLGAVASQKQNGRFMKRDMVA